MSDVERSGYPQDVTDEEWAFVLPYLLLSREDSGSRRHSLRELFKGVRYIVRAANQWHYTPNDLPPQPAVYQQRRRCMEPGVFEVLVADAATAARIRWSQGPADSGVPGQPHPAVDAGEWSEGRL